MKTTKVPQQYKQAIEKSEPSSVASSPLRFRSPLDLLWGDISSGNVCVAGDAFHPMTPYMGQGGCAALEDGVVLSKYLGEAITARGGRGDEGYRIEAALEKYANKRRWRSFNLAATSYAVGLVQESDSSIMNFLRDECLSSCMAKVMMNAADFDCGKV